MDFEIVEVIDQQTLAIAEVQPVQVLTEGIQGPPGGTLICGLGVAPGNPSPGDLLVVSPDYQWVNVPQAQITDGGNF